ncbi:chondroitinase family polysaccharide lyase [Paenibacillus sp. OAS669]|uniref:chondroitinase family polysaccharide lyase n=1 Tax=Paenibacillus sp. OAS669 TaxID=2663821 RepID=UPI001788F963|nr:chondroitinase family polysaccharide lyase [Paenibacillus sp. OAS669]MBE1444108.1 chondroitin-sulfate-ABC endolyase/exolyase [Paenibacillus sp. OAS669]
MTVIYSFEDGVPGSFIPDGQSRLAISNRRYKDGAHSLQWDYSGQAVLKIRGPIGYRPFQEGSRSQARASFAVWIYNPRPIQDKLTFQFGRKDGEQVDCEFDFRLNFLGWRTAWVAYERDMQGTPHPEMDCLIIRGPKSAGAGTLYMDQMLLCTPIDPRFHTRDVQVPFVNLRADTAANAHWLGLYAFKELEWRLPVPEEITPAQLDSHRRMEDRFEAYFLKKRPVTAEDMQRIEGKFASYDISFSADGISGRPVELPFFDHFPEPEKDRLKRLANSVQLQEYTRLMMDIAVCYRSTDHGEWKQRLKEMFMDLTDYLEDQGWAYGSSQGTVHHFGYNFRYFYPAAFLMRRVLREEERLDRTQRTMYWFSGAGRIHTPLEEVEGNVDIFNTTLHGMLASLLIMDDTPFKVRELTAFKLWLSQSLLPARGLRAAYKIDGSAYHHVNHYPAYAVGGFLGVTPVMYFTSGTEYRVTPEAHETVRKALLAMRLYSNKYEWLISLSARHPTGKWALELEPFEYMALAGTPDGTEEIDEEAAAAYLRLLKPGQPTATGERLKAMGLTPEPDPNGHWTMNYAALSIHRRGSWLAGVRGHSRYLWANETYVSANLYGRYISHGHLQIMSHGDPINHEDSGYHHDGWDWNRWPGTTTIYKPIAELRSDVRNVDTFSGFEEMLISDETYAGGLHLEGRNGMFAMKLHEHPKYEGSHRARKSFFFFDNRIICLGSDIKNENDVHPTGTTLFQNHLADPNEALWLNADKAVDRFPYGRELELDNPAWMLDNKGNGYYLPAGQTLAVSKSLQHSKHQATDADTEGRFAAAWLHHGMAPKGAGYEYAMLVQTDREGIKRFYDAMLVPDQAAYTVLRKDRSVHTVYDRESRTTAYAWFEANESANIGPVSAVDTPCMVMVREDGDRLIVSAVDPDLRLYEGTEPDQYDENGRQVEVSLYSRAWVHAESRPHMLRITLKGSWTGQGEDSRIRVVEGGTDCTIVELTCQDAMPQQLTLTRLHR